MGNHNKQENLQILLSLGDTIKKFYYNIEDKNIDVDIKEIKIDGGSYLRLRVSHSKMFSFETLVEINLSFDTKNIDFAQIFFNNEYDLKEMFPIIEKEIKNLKIPSYRAIVR